MAPLWFLVVFSMSITFSEMKPTNQGQKNGGNATLKLNESSFEGIAKANKDRLSRLYQGDIQHEDDPELQEFIRTGGNSRSGVRRRARLWTSRVIPILIPSFMNYIRTNVRTAMQEFNSKTCLRFVDYVPSYHKNYITFSNDDGCSSRVGKKYFAPGKQTISIGPGCNFVGTVMHELMHAIGFWHEQARSDRDKYVKIYWENILEGFSDQFDKYDWRNIDMLGVSYDYQSIMHYSRKAFTKNGKPTIVAIGNENMEFGTPAGRLSKRDIIDINALYDCKKQTYGWTSWSEWTPCNDKCYRRRERYCFHSGDKTSCPGANIYGVDKQEVKCPSSICPAPVDGHWGRWSEWGLCSKTCGDGVKTRTRRCNNPPQAHAGKPCQGSGSERQLCIIKRCHLDADDTDFENFRLGMWRQSKVDVLDWQFEKGFTQTGSTGPDRDHTSGKGYYLYLESSWPQWIKAGQKADLISPWMKPKPGGQCLKLYYSMYGRTMGTLDIKLELNDGRAWFIFYKKGDQGKDWKKGQGNIDPPAGVSYRLVIEARIGQPGYSDIAIDDVYIDDGLCKCQDDYVSCKRWASIGECSKNQDWMDRHCKRSCNTCGKVNGQWSSWSEWQACSKTCDDGIKTRTRKCDNPAPVQGGKTCPGNATEQSLCILKRCHLDADDTDFENSRMGMWTQSKTEALDWQFIKGFTKTMNTGPMRDHTSGKGYYLYVESSNPTKAGQKADLVSPWMTRKPGGQCLKFYYTMYGRTMGSLGVKLELSSGTFWLIFLKKGDQGKEWKRGQGNIDIPTGLKYRLVFEGRIGQPGYSDIAIDDVYIDPGLCKCQDEYVSCKAWAANGDCTTRQTWMKQNCKQSCKICGIPPNSCVDMDDKWCPLWANRGECDKNPIYMKKNCARSCKTCHVVSSTTVPPPICVDNNKIQCPLWAKTGECEKNPTYMKKNCAKSCKTCNGGPSTTVPTPSCVDNNKIQCPLWAKSGECEKNPTYMKKNCAKSCKTCGPADGCFTKPVGISDQTKIPDNQITASSQFGVSTKPAYGRLNGRRGDGWCTKISTLNGDWLKVDLGATFQVCGAATQGDRNGNEWVTDFKLSYSSDGNFWTPYKDANGKEVEFHRQGGSNQVDQHKLSVPVTARYFRFHPTKQYNWNCLRVELYGAKPGN